MCVKKNSGGANVRVDWCWALWVIVFHWIICESRGDGFLSIYTRNSQWKHIAVKWFRGGVHGARYKWLLLKRDIFFVLGKLNLCRNARTVGKFGIHLKCGKLYGKRHWLIILIWNERKARYLIIIKSAVMTHYRDKQVNSTSRYVT